MSKDIYRAVNNEFLDFVNSADGGVISVTQNIDLFITGCMFIRCKVKSNRGGGVFFDSTKSFIMTRNCVFECSAYSGYFAYVQGSSKSTTTFNSTMTTKCSGSERCVFFLKNSDVFSRDYNSTHCESGVHCNVHSFYNEITEAKFYHFYKNKQDIIFGVNSFGDKHRISYVSFIMNEVSQRLYGYIHTNDYANEVLSVSNMYAYENQHKLINPLNGKIMVKSFFGDEFTCTGNGVLSTEDISVSKGFIMKSRFKKEYVCRKTKGKIVNKIKEYNDSLSMLIFIILSS